MLSGDDEASVEGLSVLNPDQLCSRGSSTGRENPRSISIFPDEVSWASFTELIDDASCTAILKLFQEYLFFLGMATF